MSPSGSMFWPLAATGLAAWGCAHAPATSEGHRFEVIVDDAATTTASGRPQPAAYTAAWIRYATTRGTVYEEMQEGGSRNTTGDDYLIEVRARSGLADFWKEQRQQGEVEADTYLDKLVEVREAGFIEEYVIGTFARPGWTVPATELSRIDLASFADWGPPNLGEIESPMHAWMTPPSGKMYPGEPGAGLPDPDVFAPPDVPCGRSLGALRKAVAAWEVEAVMLDGAPVAARDRSGFIGQLLELGREAPYRTRGMTWVSPRPLGLTYLAGFCAIEATDFSFAVRSLRTAVELSPRLPGPRLELAHALIGQGEFDRADAAIQVVLDKSQDRCELGRAWRKRGYIRFEEGRLVDAAVRSSAVARIRSEKPARAIGARIAGE